MKEVVSALILAGSLSFAGMTTAQAIQDPGHRSKAAGASTNAGPANIDSGNTGVTTLMLLWGAAGIGAMALGAGSVAAATRRAKLEA
ncbi:hypothetical protein [Arthrobacter sp. ISL-28]|uniref:hypothetical protein n=1 Tax=Arthrobacter sp. ISL-28 TaxID=2819108 RepID=UPI001BE590E5|nr:hypothetical protein [Arthrobacter sp. ISL-28]MBT2519665.1 hypothetical protein [Arthrobacter sp. ISL-28]